MCLGSMEKMSDKINGDDLENIPENILENPEINDPSVVTQPENDQMENSVEGSPFSMNFNGGQEWNLRIGLHFDMQQEQPVDDQGNEMDGNDVADEPIVDNPQPLQSQLPTEARAMDPISVSLASHVYDAVIIDRAEHAMVELLKVAKQKQLLPPNFREHPLDVLARQNMSEDSELEQSSFAFYGPNNIKMEPVPGQEEHYVFPLQPELSREIAVLEISRIEMIDLLMDPFLFSTDFPDIVARASVIREIVPGTADYDGTIQVMKIQYHMPTPLASTREGYFLRHSKKVSEDTWAVVDLSIDKLFVSDEVTYRRNWSGCTILELPSLFTKINWLENVEVNNSKYHSMLQGIVGFQFGAKRWISALARQAEWMKCPALRCDYKGKFATPEGASDLLILAQKMMEIFFANASSSPENNNWMPISGAEDMKVAHKPYRTGSEVAAADGRRTIVMATTVLVPIIPKELFQFLSDRPASPIKLDHQTTRYRIREKLRIKIGEDKDSQNVVSLLQVETERGDQPIMYLQRSYTDSICSFSVSAPIDAPTMKTLLDGEGDPNNIEILPSGFVLFPDRPSMSVEDNNGGSLLTAVFQIMDPATESEDGGSSSSNAAQTGIQNLMEETLRLIKNAARGE